MSILAVMGLAGGVPLVTPTQAFACSCAYPADGSQIVDHVSQAAAVFTGTATSERVEGQNAFYEFDVREVFDGEVDASTTVSSSVQGPACGRSFDVGTEYLVFTSTYETHGAQWSVSSCSATTESTDSRTREAALTVYGQPRTPSPEVTSATADESSTSSVDIGTPRVWIAAAIITAIAAGALLALFRSSRPRRR